MRFVNWVARTAEITKPNPQPDPQSPPTRWSGRGWISRSFCRGSPAEYRGRGRWQRSTCPRDPEARFGGSVRTSGQLHYRWVPPSCCFLDLYEHPKLGELLLLMAFVVCVTYHASIRVATETVIPSPSSAARSALSAASDRSWGERRTTPGHGCPLPRSPGIGISMLGFSGSGTARAFEVGPGDRCGTGECTSDASVSGPRLGIDHSRECRPESAVHPGVGSCDDEKPCTRNCIGRQIVDLVGGNANTAVVGNDGFNRFSRKPWHHTSQNSGLSGRGNR